MSRRLRRDTHKRISSAGYQRIAGDLEVTGQITGPSITDIFSALQVVACSTQTPVQLTVTRCEGAYKAIIIQWQMQYNLATFSHYEVQVSSDDSTWYSLEFDGTDWKDVLDADTDVQAPLIVHVPIPFGGTTGTPTAVTLYYRVRQKTVTGTTGTWSSSASATTSLVQTGDVAANAITATKILAGAVTAAKITAATMQTLLLKAAYLWIGFEGTGTYDSPNEGDRRIYADNDEITFEVYTDGAWSTERQIALGGVDSNGNFRPFLGCRGILGDITDSPLLDPIPGRGFHLFKFDNNAQDQHGVDPWTVTLGAFVYDAGTKWEGTHSLSPSASLLNAWYAANWTIGDSVTACFMFRDDGSQIGHDIIEWGTTGVSNRINIEYAYSRAIEIEIEKGGTVTRFYSAALSTGAWHFICFTYNSVTNTAYLRVDTNEYSATPSGAWGSGTQPIYLTLGGGTYQRRMDDLLISHDTAMDPDLFFQHVERNVAWTADYFAPDILLKPKSGGRVVIDDSDTEPSLGTGHWRGNSSGGANLLNQNPTIAGSWYTVTFSNAPVGAKAAWAYCLLTSGGGLLTMAKRKYGDTVSVANTLVLYVHGAIYLGCLVRLPLDGSKRAQVGSDQAIQIRIYETLEYDI